LKDDLCVLKKLTQEKLFSIYKKRSKRREHIYKTKVDAYFTELKAKEEARRKFKSYSRSRKTKTPPGKKTTKKRITHEKKI